MPFIQIGVVLLILALLGRIVGNLGLAPLPVALLTGLLAAQGGPLPDRLRVPPGALEVAAPLAAAVVLLCLGLEHTRADRAAAVRTSLPLGVADAIANLVPGLLAGLVLGWDVRAALLLGGATWVSSSGQARGLIGGLGRIGHRETPAVLKLLVLEHLAMAAYLPVVAALLTDGGTARKVAALLASAAAVTGAAWVVREHGPSVRRAVFGDPDDIVLPLLGMALLAAGVLAELRVAAAAGAYLAGFVLGGPVTGTEPARAVLPVLRAAATTATLFFFGAAVAVDHRPARVVLAAVGLAALTTLTKLATGFWIGRAEGVGRAARWRAGATLTGRNEFAVVLGLLGVQAGIEPDLGLLVALYVLLTSAASAVLTRRVPSRLLA